MKTERRHPMAKQNQLLATRSKEHILELTQVLQRFKGIKAPFRF